MAIIVAAAGSGRVFAADAPANIDSVLQDMLVRGAQFPPEKLLALGPEGFSAVLDRIFPETATIEEVDVADEVVDGLIADLGAENFQTREAASERLARLGPGGARSDAGRAKPRRRGQLPRRARAPRLGTAPAGRHDALRGGDEPGAAEDHRQPATGGTRPPRAAPCSISAFPTAASSRSSARRSSRSIGRRTIATSIRSRRC